MRFPNAAQYTGDPQHMMNLRMVLNLDRHAFGKSVGVSERTIYRWESGEAPYTYAHQYLAESLVDRTMCDEIRTRVVTGGGCLGAVIYAQTLYLSGRATVDGAVARAVHWQIELRKRSHVVEMPR